MTVSKLTKRQMARLEEIAWADNPSRGFWRSMLLRSKAPIATASLIELGLVSFTDRYVSATYTGRALLAGSSERHS